MKIYLYKEGLLNLLELITFLLETNRKPDFIKEENYETNLLDEVIDLQRNPRKNLWKNWEKNIGKKALKTILYVYISETKAKELIIYYFLKNALKYKENIFYIRNLKCVNKTIQISERVRHEIHKQKGFLRFKETKNHFLYGEIEPESNILYFLAKHFKERLKEEHFLIHDKKRHLLCVYDTVNVYLIKEEEVKKLEIEYEKEELDIEDLWKTFFQTIAIEERKNERCQKSFMPKKYWKYMIEMEDKL